jgi:hypothetical protein
MAPKTATGTFFFQKFARNDDFVASDSCATTAPGAHQTSLKKYNLIPRHAPVNVAGASSVDLVNVIFLMVEKTNLY